MKLQEKWYLINQYKNYNPLLSVFNSMNPILIELSVKIIKNYQLQKYNSYRIN